MKKKARLQKRLKRIYHTFELFKGTGLEKGSCYEHNCSNCTWSAISRSCFPCSSCGNMINSKKCYFERLKESEAK